MTDPSGFERPPGWRNLDGSPQAVNPAEPPQSAAASGPPQAPVQQPIAAPTNTGAEPVRRKRRPVSTFLIGLSLMLSLVVLIGVAQQWISRSSEVSTPASASSAPASTRSSPTSSQAPAVDTEWRVEAAVLRPDLPEATLVHSPGGPLDTSDVIDPGKAWVVLTGTVEDGEIAVHGVDSGTGGRLWQRELPGALCAEQALPDGVVCAWTLKTDPATGAGTSWRVAVLDPATGVEKRGVDLDGAFIMVRLSGDTVLLVEERSPGPHAVVRGLTAQLRQRWRLDLSTVAGHDELFASEPTALRRLPRSSGPYLNPWLTPLPHGLTALTSESRTAFIETATGRLRGLPRCARVVADDDRLWCDEQTRVAAYSYGLKRLYTTEDGLRLARPCLSGDRPTWPVFINSDGAATRVNLADGRTQGRVAESRNGTRAGHLVEPSSCQAGALTVISDTRSSFAVDPVTGKQLWQADWQTPVDLVPRDGRLLVATSDLFWIDPGTGNVLARRDQLGTTRAVGEALVGFGMAELVRVREP